MAMSVVVVVVAAAAAAAAVVVVVVIVVLAVDIYVCLRRTGVGNKTSGVESFSSAGLWRARAARLSLNRMLPNSSVGVFSTSRRRQQRGASGQANKMHAIALWIVSERDYG